MHERRFAKRGSITVQTAIIMVVLLALVAMGVDVGMLYIARTELQRTADAAAMAAAWELVDLKPAAGGRSFDAQISEARTKAQQFVSLNHMKDEPMKLGSDDVKVGLLSDPSNATHVVQEGASGAPNAVYVQVQWTKHRNKEVPLFFARILGVDRAAVKADATAYLNFKFNGFRNPPDGSNLNILPFAIDAAAWEALMAGEGTDKYMYDPEADKIANGQDGVKEIRLYPNDTGSSGNSGTLDIGASNNSTGDIARQIREGISPKDLAQIGGALEFDSQGKLYLNADPGKSLGFKDDLMSIRGQTRVIPLYSDIKGGGNNALYTITKFVGVRIMNVKLNGGGDGIVVQPAAVVIRGGIPGPNEDTTEFIFSPVRLVR